MIPSDFIEITLWEPTKARLIPYRFLPNAGVERQLEPAGEGYRLDEGYSGYIARERKSLLVPNTQVYRDLQPALDLSSIPIRSFLGVPLLAGQELIGTLELGSISTGMYQESDLELVKLISGQAAIAIHNAMLYRDEQRRAAELTGLARLSQAVGTAMDPQGLYTRLVESIVPLVNAEVVGFLLFQESQRALVGQAPFYGMPPQFIEIYRCNIIPGSPAEALVTSQKTIVTQNAAEDPQWETLALDHLAQVPACARRGLPVTAGGKMWGICSFEPYRGSNLYRRRITAGRLLQPGAPIIENFTLVQQTRLRAQAPKRCAGFAKPGDIAATLDEILNSL